ncbi:hypothetical protein V8E51_013843 [Hyaloscypha variabilis]
MGKGKGKKGKKDPKSAIKKSTEITKVKAPRPVNPIKKVKKLMSKDKKAERDAIPPIGSDMDAIRKAASDRVMKNLLHAKWPALFKKHLGVIESHILALDRTMMSMKTEMEHMPEKQRLEWELGERGNFRVLCEMMDRARQVLVDARRSAQGILPPERLRDKKGLGVKGTEFELLGPKLAQKAAELGYTKRGKLGRDPDAVSSDSDTDTEISNPSSSSDDADAVTKGADFVPLNVGAKVPRFPTVEDSGADKEKTTTNGVEPNPYFVVDTNPTPVIVNGNGVVKLSKKRATEDDGEEQKSKKTKKEKHTVSEPAVSFPVEPEIDFAAVEAALQAEVEAAEAIKAQEAHSAESSENKKSKKKRRRSSDGDELVEKKKVKKDSKQVEEESSVNATEPSLLPEENTGKKRRLSETASGDEVVEKKHKKEKKEKKRKAEADGAEVAEGKKKKRKQKVVAESE